MGGNRKRMNGSDYYSALLLYYSPTRVCAVGFLVSYLLFDPKPKRLYSKHKTAVPACMPTPEHLTQTPWAVIQSWFCFCLRAFGVSGLVFATSRPPSHNSYQLGNGEGSLRFPLSMWSHTFSLHHMQHQGELWRTWRKVQSIHFPAHELRNLGLASAAVTDRKEGLCHRSLPESKSQFSSLDAFPNSCRFLMANPCGISGIIQFRPCCYTETIHVCYSLHFL